MAKVTLDQVLEEVKVLTRDDQQQLRKLLDEMLAKQEEGAKIEAFHKALLSAGLVKSIKTQPTIGTSDRRLIKVKGKPLSETIVEERR